ncbi:protein D3-like [Lycorma delicatula]|uniref:protein D3-like n=1 Tax=Lycorma delicatula TaxID=130591 RepID=UPI003F50F5BB
MYIIFNIIFILILKSANGDEYNITLEYYEVLVKAVVPDVVDDIEHEVAGLFVKYPNVTTLLGNELAPIETIDEPDLFWYVEKRKENGSWFTISMTDPDAPCRDNPRFREWQHWLVVNIPGMKVHEGEHLTEYVGPSPAKGTGLHRYIFLLFQQPGKINFNEPLKTVENKESRKNFNTREFMKRYNLPLPLGGNWFISQWDSEVTFPANFTFWP